MEIQEAWAASTQVIENVGMPLGVNAFALKTIAFLKDTGRRMDVKEVTIKAIVVKIAALKAARCQVWEELTSGKELVSNRDRDIGRQCDWCWL